MLNDRCWWQIYVRIRNEEWNTYRRYAEFYEFHSRLKKRNPIFSTFDFPPKKTFGKKVSIFVVSMWYNFMKQLYMRKTVYLFTLVSKVVIFLCMMSVVTTDGPLLLITVRYICIFLLLLLMVWFYRTWLKVVINNILHYDIAGRSLPTFRCFVQIICKFLFHLFAMVFLDI